jgi:N6-L-threonylcarbamoyladenine synthase
MAIALGIETSCDETAAAIVSSSGEVLSDVVHTQVAIHAPYGGVVPEVAARDHALSLGPTVELALARAGLGLDALDGVAVTHRPGLSGALLVGLVFAKGLAFAAERPIVGVDHLVAHLLAVFLRREGASPVPAYPFIGLLVSGGHTAIYRVGGPSHGDIHEIGATRDDAAGEAFDKVAKMLGLGYPGGPMIDKLAQRGDATKAPIELPVAMRDRASFEMSFSGLKSAVARHIEKTGVPTGEALAHLAAAFQANIVDTLVKKTIRAAEREGIPRVVIGGGVAANQGLREGMRKGAAKRGIEVFIPPLASCTDNAAMIAYTGALRLDRGERDDLSLAPATKTALLRVTRKGGGPR